jgi:hypothetical protein
MIEVAEHTQVKLAGVSREAEQQFRNHFATLG